jgi:ribonuclease P protein component
MRWYGRLRRSGEIAFVRRRGRRVDLETLSLYAAPGRNATLVAVTASKAVGGAVARNLIRRRIRGALDALGPAAGAGRRLVVVAKPAAASAPYGRLAADLRAGFGKLAAA